MTKKEEIERIKQLLKSKKEWDGYEKLLLNSLFDLMTGKTLKDWFDASLKERIKAETKIYEFLQT